MSTPKQYPMAWKYGGDQVKRFRQRTGVTREQLAQASHYDIESVRSMEAGRRRPTFQLLQAADELCDANGMLVAAAAFMVPERFAPFSHDLMQYEPEAIVLSSYQNQLIPGLLQTEPTVRSLLSVHWPPMDDETLEARLLARLARQEILGNQTKSFNFLIDEFALLRRIGTTAGHKEQLERLLEVGKPRHIDIQVVPGTTLHPGVNGAFVLLETPEHERLAYEEGQAIGFLYSDPEKVNGLWQRHATIQRQALSPEESARFINKLAEEL
ncbi:helix-turn-helix domain-containing protein [Kitasatospora sp. NPDC091335]|uniref:helix-turn-helix domain-containing protein n=1 Tax=Kitasatospora sp. NPDC091335 TaxID=3364085 RepID=UPI0037F64519